MSHAHSPAYLAEECCFHETAALRRLLSRARDAAAFGHRQSRSRPNLLCPREEQCGSRLARGLAPASRQREVAVTAAPRRAGAGTIADLAPQMDEHQQRGLRSGEPRSCPGIRKLSTQPRAAADARALVRSGPSAGGPGGGSKPGSSLRASGFTVINSSRGLAVVAAAASLRCDGSLFCARGEEARRSKGGSGWCRVARRSSSERRAAERF